MEYMKKVSIYIITDDLEISVLEMVRTLIDNFRMVKERGRGCGGDAYSFVVFKDAIDL